MKEITTLHARLETELNEISDTAVDVLDLAKRSHEAVERAMKELKKFAVSYSFSDEEEIQFFKEIKPIFYSKLIYYVRLFDIESNFPAAPAKAQTKYLNKQLSSITRFLEDNEAFYKYYRSGASYMDEIYFLRNKFNIVVGLDTCYLDFDPLFCTGYDHKLATILANEQLALYIEKKLQKSNDTTNKFSMLEELGLNWADTKTSFVELLYALQSLGAFYNVKTKAKADVKDIARFFEVVLNMELGNYYRLFYDIRLRKKERTPFLDKLKDSVIRRMDEPDL
ncbi:MAG: RteC domain-containing protein [Bacteroidetes bacterium]|nr:RteC domain-containing protein [Bacteroidota bacterium]